MKISEQVFLIGSGKYGIQISHSIDCNIYLLDGGGGEYAMIDAGGGVEPERIVQHIVEAGVKPEQLKYLLLTHAHADHMAGAAYFQQRYGLEVIASKEAQPWIEHGDRDKTSLNAAVRAGVYPANFQLPACPVSRGVVEHDVIKLGNSTLTIIDTPGHSRGHLSFLLEQQGKKALFAGDTVFAGGKIVLQNIWDCSIQYYAATLAKLHHLQIDSLFPGHGPFILEQAWKHVEQAHGYFERLEIPPNL